MRSHQSRPIQEAESEGDSSENKSDATSSESSGDSSIDAAINGDETEDALYERILAEQEGRDEECDEEQKKKESGPQLEELVDKNMVNLLIYCTMLQKPPKAEIEQRKVHLGPTERSKLLILDMDETLLHSRFHKLTGENDAFETGI